MPHPISLSVWQRVGHVLFSSHGGWKPKAAALFVAAYIVWPADLVPDVPLLGWLDDVGLTGVLLWYLLHVGDGKKKTDHTA